MKCQYANTATSASGLRGQTPKPALADAAKIPIIGNYPSKKKLILTEKKSLRIFRRNSTDVNIAAGALCHKNERKNSVPIFAVIIIETILKGKL